MRRRNLLLPPWLQPLKPALRHGHPPAATPVPVQPQQPSQAASWSRSQTGRPAHPGPRQTWRQAQVQEALRRATQRWRRLLIGRWWPNHSLPRREAGWKIFCFILFLFPKLLFLFWYPKPPCCPTVGTSLAPLVPLARSLGAWLALPGPSRWLLQTIRFGYTIQFTRRPPKFRGIRFTSVKAVDAPVLCAEIAVLLAKNAIEPVPPADIRSGFYSPYFIVPVPKKSGGLRPILDLRVLNRALHKLPFKMFAAIDLKDAYFHVSILPRHRPFLRFAFEGRAYQYKVPPLELSLSPRFFTKRTGCAHPQLPRRLAHTCTVSRAVVRTQGPGAQAPQPVGSSGQLGKEQTRANAEDLFSWHGVGFGQPDSRPHPGTCSVGAELPQDFIRQDGGPSETLSEAPGAYGCSCGDSSARSAPYETASALAPWPSPEVGVETRYSPVQITLACHKTFSLWTDPLFLRAGVPLEQVSRHAVVFTDASATGGVATCKVYTVSGYGRVPQLHWHINCLELLAVRLALSRLRGRLGGKDVLVHMDNTATVAYINRQGGLRSRRMSQLARHLLLWSQKHLRSLRAIHIPGVFNRAADELSRAALPGEWRLHPQAVQLIWGQFGVAQVDLFASPETTHCQWFYSLTEATLGTDALAHSWPQSLRKYAFPPVSLLAQTLCKIREDVEQVLLVAPYWPNRTWFPELMLLATALPGRFLWGRICFLRDGAPSGTHVQTCGNSMCGLWTGTRRF